MSNPTEEQIEAAAKAIYGEDPNWGYIDEADHGEGAARWEHLGDELHEWFRARARAALVAAAEVTPPEEGKLRQLIADLVGEDDCYFDHHGGCQTHGYISLKPGEMCPHQEGKEWLGE